MAAYLSTALPNCRYEILPDFGHFYLVQDPDLFLDRIIDFLRDPAGYVAREDSSTEDKTQGRDAEGSDSEASYENPSTPENLSLDQ
jgi:hypothetical protein